MPPPPWHAHGRRWRWPLRHWIRAKLQRRLFLWFALSIVVTTLVVTGAFALLNRATETGWRQEVGRVERWVGHQFARAWDDPAALESLARGLSEDLSAGVIVHDARGALVARHGRPCRGGLKAPIWRGGALLGRVTVCLDRRPSRRGQFLIPLAIALVVLWAASGAVARRLARPLSELADVAERLGRGKLSTRAAAAGRRDEIGVVASAVNEMASRIEKQMADQRELLAAVSHELRTPLSRIRLLTEMARQKYGEASAFDDLDREVEEVDGLVGQLLANSRIDFGALASRLLDVADVAARALERAGLSKELLTVDTAAWVSADATLLARALANLIDNARKHGGGLERLNVREEGEFVVFEALDRGKGFAPGELERVFEAFRHRREGPLPEGSLGMGLALVQRIALAHGGSVFAENRTGGGGAVGLRLPRMPPSG